jgi:ectoine hydroxylase-related dioxygenase (phytanoyl-CoA dioxygenase family)
MNPASHVALASSTETGSTGIYQLKRLWSKAIAGPHVANLYPDEMQLESSLIDILGIGLLPAYQFLYGEKPDFESFEKWIINRANGQIDVETVQRCNALFESKNTLLQHTIPDVLTPTDILFWEKYGYVIIRDAVSKEDVVAAKKAILHYLEMEEDVPASWYKDNNTVQGIMVPLYRNAAIDKNRNSPKIRSAFEQLWHRTDLVVTTDKCGFNPPETATFKYRGTSLHWDVSLATPIPFGTQGILYLTDTAAHQGALTVVPEFHKKIESWLKNLPKNDNPRDADFSIFGSTPIAANAGDFIIWNHKLPHGSSPNRASYPRIVQYINWYDPLQKIQDRWV